MDNKFEQGLDVTRCLGCAVAKYVRGHSYPVLCRSMKCVCLAIDPDYINGCDDATLDKIVAQRYVSPDSECINKPFLYMLFNFEKDIVKQFGIGAIEYVERG